MVGPVPTSSSGLTRRGLLAGAAGVGAAALVGCSPSGGGGTPGAPAEPMVMTVWGGDTDKAAYQARLDALKAAHPDIVVTLQMIPSAQYAQKVQTMISGGHGPDILELAETVNVYSSKNQIIPQDEYIAKAGLDVTAQFGERMPQYFQYEDKQYAIPDRSGAMITYYNKEHFEAKGVPAPTDWTWDDLIDYGPELTGDGKFAHAGFNWWPLWMSLIYQNGGTVLDPASGQPTLTSPECVEAMQFIQDLTYKHKIVPTARDFQNWGPDAGGDSMFAAGNISISTTGFWNIGTLAKAGKIDFDLAQFLAGKQRAVCASFNGLAISRTCQRPEDAFTAINFLTGAEAQQTIIGMGQDVPANLEVQNSQEFLKPKWLKKDLNMEVFPQSADAIFVPPLIPEWNEMIKAMDDSLAGYWQGTEPAAAALGKAQERVAGVLSRRR
jgi:multiple sugar transport system substrate-binding protein